MDSGWIKLHRKFLKWEWYTDANTKSVFLHLLLNANYEERKWRGKTIEVGEVVTSVKSLSRELKLTTQQTRTALERLKSTNEITIKTTNKYSVIKVCNYGIYQDLEVEEQQTKQQSRQQTSNKQVTNKQQTNNKQITTPKEIKELKETEELKDNKDHIAVSGEEEQMPEKNQNPKRKKEIYGEYKNVLLTDEEINRLFKDYGESETLKAIKFLDEAIEMKGYKYKNHNLALRKWVFDAMRENEERKNKHSPKTQQTNDDFFGGIADWVSKNQEGGIDDGCESIW